jgi:hypothetical protein
MEDDWRGRWGSESYSSTSRQGGSRAVAAEESEDELDESGRSSQPNGVGAMHIAAQGGEKAAESIPAGLVSAAPLIAYSSLSPEPELAPQTPPQQMSSLDSENRSGSPTPKAKTKGLAKRRETEEQKKRRLEEEERKAEKEKRKVEEAKAKIREELIMQEEKEKLKKKKTMESLRTNGSTSGKRSAKSRSKSKSRRKGTKGT